MSGQEDKKCHQCKAPEARECVFEKSGRYVCRANLCEPCRVMMEQHFEQLHSGPPKARLSQ